MVKTKELPEFERIEIIRHSSSGLSQRKVAQVIGCSQNTVTTTLQRYKEHQTIKNLHRTGRNPISNARDQRHLINLVKKNRRFPVHQLAEQWEFKRQSSKSESCAKSTTTS